MNLIGSECGAGILNQSHNVVEHIYEEIPDCSRNSIEKLLSILVVFDLGKIFFFFFFIAIIASGLLLIRVSYLVAIGFILRRMREFCVTS